MEKLEVARRQLGTALFLFIEDQDPVSVHSLAGNAREIIERLCESSSIKPFSNHILKIFPDMSKSDVYELANRYRNSFKHNDPQNNDSAILSQFSDIANDALLFIAWTDYHSLTGKLPIEAQIFLAWYYSIYPEKLADTEEGKPYQDKFPNITRASRSQAKSMLRQRIVHYRNDAQFATDPATENLPLSTGASIG
jgi:hypothetical protein